MISRRDEPLPRWVDRYGAWVRLSLASAVLAASASWFGAAHAQRIENGTAVFAALDKVTARISRLDVKLNETTTFGALKVTPRACYSRPPTEPPKTATFLEVDEIMLDGKVNRIFTGWMFAESPALNPLEHAVFDIWLTECAVPLRPGVAEKGPARPRSPAGSGPAAAPPPIPAEPPSEDQRRRRPR